MTQLNTQVNTQKTLTLKSCGISIPTGAGEYLGKTVLAVMGAIDGYFVKNTQYGESVCLTGDFIATNLITGEVFEGSNIYLPNDYAEKVAKQLDNSEAGSVIVLDKPIEILVAGSEKAGRGYTFVTRNLQTIEVINKRALMAKTLLKAVSELPRLEAPKEVKNKK